MLKSIMHFLFGSIFFLALLVFIPCFFLCKNHGKQYYFPKLSWIKKESALLNWELWLKILIFSLMVLALAKPFVYDANSNDNKRGRDLVLAIDASGSMAESGYNSKKKFQNKYDSTIELAKEFTKKRLDDNMAVVIFGTFAYTASPLTYDLESLSFMLDMTNEGIAGESTAIGDAIMQSIQTLSLGSAKNRVIILLTDGYHNAGRVSPKVATQKAKELGIKIYTIGIGKKRDYDLALLQTIAKDSGAKSYSAASAEDLKVVFEEIDKIEPSEIRGENYLNKKILIIFPLLLVFMLLLGWSYYLARSKV